MLILAFESSAKAASVALVKDGELISQYSQCTALTHSRTLLPMAEDMLKNAELSMADVDMIAVAHGPGSFTGIRIGVSTVKGLAWAADKPCVGVSTLDAMAWQGLSVGGYICPVMDARRNQVYNALFYANHGVLERIREDRAISLSDLAEELKALDGPIFLVGDGSNLTCNTLQDAIPTLVLPPEHRMHQRASGVALAAARKIAAGEPGDGAALTPNYLRLSQAERERLEKQQK